MGSESQKKWKRFETYPLSSDYISEYVERFSRHAELKGKSVSYLAFKVLLKMVGGLSWTAAYRISGWLGLLMVALKVREKVAMTNLDIVYGDLKSDAEKRAIYKASLINFARVIINHMRLPYQNDDFWKNHCTIENLDLLEDAYKKGRGVIILGGHIGMMDLGGGMLGRSGYPAAAIAKKMKDPVLDKIVVDARKSMNLGTIAHRGSIRRIISGLKRGEAILIVIDQNMKRSDSIFINWMGHLASAMPSSAYLAKRTKAPVISGYFVQTAPCRFELRFVDAVPFVPYEKDEKKELLLNTQLQVDAVQKIIYQYPELWFWIHRRYKIQPNGKKYPY